ncbi:MAG TPA: hypothetical protein EYP68_08460 [Candidatus Korarchaeota archaeon]|nr:hypothetical protein [Candidatus Korarchaeota archaeon]
MSRKTKAVISAVLYVLSFVILPNIGLAMAPEEVINYSSNLLGTDLRSFVTVFSVLGAILGGLSIVNGIVGEKSYIYLISSIATPIVWYYLSLYGLGLGSPGNFGRTLISVTREEGVMTVLIDIRIILVILGLAAIFEIISCIVEFLGLREK